MKATVTRLKPKGRTYDEIMGRWFEDNPKRGYFWCVLEDNRIVVFYSDKEEELARVHVKLRKKFGDVNLTVERLYCEINWSV